MTYIIDYSRLTVHNAHSHGPKPIDGIHGDDSGFYHVSYVNDDMRLWYQFVTYDEAAVIDTLLNTPDAVYSANDYGLGEGLEL